MNWSQIHSIYFLGIGGIGMSALAKYANVQGKKVYGYDLTPSVLTEEMIQVGINIQYNESLDVIKGLDKETTLVVYTPAVPSTNAIMQFVQQNGFNLVKRAKMLGLQVNNQNCIAVAGTHGKTTTSSLLSFILDKTCGTNAFLGGVVKDFQGNLLVNKNSDLVVVEADEFDRSFLQLQPTTAIVTNVDPDHLDIYQNESDFYQTFQDFVSQIKEGGLLVKHSSVASTSKEKTITYGFENEADVVVENVKVVGGFYQFDLIGLINQKNLVSVLPGKHNVLNLTAAIISAHFSAKVTLDDIKKVLPNFKGINRRFEYVLKSDSHTVIEDYAHHPTEIKACVESAREMYPEAKISGLFQPHLFSRTSDFANDFARELGKLDELVLTDIYPARELPIKGVDSAWLLSKIELENKELVSFNQIVNYYKENKPEVLLIMGAGDIGLLSKQIAEEINA